MIKFGSSVCVLSVLFVGLDFYYILKKGLVCKKNGHGSAEVIGRWGESSGNRAGL